MASRLKERWKELLAEYGRIAIAIYLVFWVIAAVGFWIAISSGLDLGSWTGGKAGTFAATWVVLKVTQLPRIGVTILLTPLVARIVRGKPSPAFHSDSESDDSESEGSESDGESDDSEE